MKTNMRVWRKDGERFDPSCVITTYKSGYQLVNVDGSFLYYEKVPLWHIDGSFKNPKYIEICEKVVCPWVTQLYGSLVNFVLQEDN